MASLAELLNPKSKKSTALQNGQIVRTSNEELNSLAQKSNLPAAPITPAGAQMLGAGPDVAKMAGSAQQKQAAIRQSIQESESLDTQQRQAQPRKEQTEEEKTAQERAQRLTGLGNLEGRVQEIANKMLAGQTAQQQAPQQLSLNQEAIQKSGVAPENQTQFQDLLNKMTAGTATNEDIQAANQLMGRNASNLLTADQLKGMFGGTAQQVGANVTGALANNVTVGNLDQNQVQQLGFNNLDDMAQVLNVAPADLGNMTIDQLQEKVKQIKSGEYQQTQTLQKQASDPNLGAAERAEARKNLREAGAVGTRAADENVADLAQQLEGADTVKFNGQQMSVKELLSDANLNGVIQRFIDDPNYKEQLEKEEPEFADWLNVNQTAVKQMMDKIDPAVKQYNQLQADRAGAAKTAQGTTLSDDLMKMVYNDWGSLGTSAYDQSKEPEALKIVKSESADPTVRANLEDFLNQTAKSDPILAQNILNLSRPELAALGVFDKGSRGLQDYMDYNTSIKAAQTAQSPEEFMSSVFGTNLKDAQQLIDQARSLKNLGINVPNLDLFDSDGDGKVDSLDQLKKNTMGPGRLFDGNQLGIQGIIKSGRQLSDLPKGSSVMGSLSDALKKVDPDTASLAKYTKDGSFSDSDAYDFASSNDLNSVNKLLNNPNVNLGSSKKYLQDVLNSKVTDQVKNAVGGGEAYSYLQNLQDAVQNPSAVTLQNFDANKVDTDKQNLASTINNLKNKLTSETQGPVRDAYQKQISSLTDTLSKLTTNANKYQELKDAYQRNYSQQEVERLNKLINENQKR